MIVEVEGASTRLIGASITDTSVTFHEVECARVQKPYCTVHQVDELGIRNGDLQSLEACSIGSYSQCQGQW